MTDINLSEPEHLKIIPKIVFYLRNSLRFKCECPIFAVGGGGGIIDLFSISLEYMGSLCVGGVESLNSIMRLCALPNKILASKNGKNIKIWDIKKRTLISTLSGHSDGVTALCSVREDIFVSGSYDKSLIIWHKQPESSTYSPNPKLTGHTSFIIGIVKINNTEIASGGGNGELRIWNIDQGSCTHHIPNASSKVSDRIYHMKQGIEGEVVIGHPYKVKKWGAFNGWVGHFKQFPDLCEGGPIEFFSEGDLLLRGGNKGELEFINYKDRYEGPLPLPIQGLHSDSILGIQRIAKDIVVTTSIDGYVKVSDPISRICYMKFKKDDGWKKAIAYFY